MQNLDLKEELILNQLKEGLTMAAKLIVEICGGEVSNFDIQETLKFKKKIIKFDPKLVSRSIGIKLKKKILLKYSK